MMSTGEPRLAALSRRLHMTEGQLYTTVLAALLVALLSLTGLPNAHQRRGGDSLSGTSPVLEQPTGATP
jgi:hypothetical protein